MKHSEHIKPTSSSGTGGKHGNVDWNGESCCDPGSAPIEPPKTSVAGAPVGHKPKGPKA